VKDEQAIRDLIAAWMGATKAGDVDAILRLMSDDVVFLRPGMPPMRGKAEFAASLKAVAPARIDARSDIREVKVAGDWAYCWNHLTVVFTPPEGSAKKREGDVLSIFRRQPDGSWVLTRDANLLSG
jgi:uncharacterized protein (TIGR02246 family)